VVIATALPAMVYVMAPAHPATPLPAVELLAPPSASLEVEAVHAEVVLVVVVFVVKLGVAYVLFAHSAAPPPPALELLPLSLL
jgi:hypothetical protein